MKEFSSLDTSTAVYVDAGALLDSRLTGIGRYTARLINALGQLGPVKLFTTIQANEAFSAPQHAPCWGTEISVNPDQLAELGAIDNGVEDWARKLMRLPVQPSSEEEVGKSVAVFPVFRPLFRAFRKEIGIFFDFTPLIMPWVHAPETVRHFCALFGKAAPLYDSVIAISESTRSDAMWLSTIAPEKVATCYAGPSQCEHTHARIEKRSGKVILAVASLEPRKNASFLIKWFLESESLEPGTELWWAGARGWWASNTETKELQQLAASRKDRKIKFLGFVSDDELCGLYQSSMMTVYPSLYEGFGFPVLDSLLHNTPVLTSYNSSLVEFEGPGVFYFDPYDEQSLDAAYRECLGKRGEFFIEIDTLRKKYRWENVAKRIRQFV